MYLSVGIDYDRIMNGNPQKLKPYIIAYENKLENYERLAHRWWFDYGIPAIAIGVRTGAWGKGKIDYPKEPTVRKQELTEAEMQKKREEFVMKMRIMKMNWDLSHSRK